MVTDDDPQGDWTAPGVFRCAPGVFRIPLPLPSDGLRAVNVYAVADGDGFTLVDSGWAIAEARELLESALAQLGGGLCDVRRFLVTHVHRDHYTLAVQLRSEFGTEIRLGGGERPGLEAIIGAGDGFGPRQTIRLVRAGADVLVAKLEAFVPPVENADIWQLPDQWITDGAEIVVGEGAGLRTLTAVATPGHTRGHVVFADEPGDLLFAGDHVLPRITPSIGLEALSPPNPLGDFLDSLELVRNRPDAALLPAHGAIGMRVHERVDELLAHHGKRLDASLAAVAEGRHTAAEVATALTWTRREHKLADLDLFNEMLAVLETASHLDVLVQRGALQLTTVDEVAHYSI